MVFNNQQISSFSMVNDCINSLKYMVLDDTFENMEATSPEFRQVLEQMTQDHLRLVEEWHKIIESRNWNQTQIANTEVINQALEHVQSFSSRIQPGQFNYPQTFYKTGQY